MTKYKYIYLGVISPLNGIVFMIFSSSQRRMEGWLSRASKVCRDELFPTPQGEIPALSIQEAIEGFLLNNGPPFLTSDYSLRNFVLEFDLLLFRKAI